MSDTANKKYCTPEEVVDLFRALSGLHFDPSCEDICAAWIRRVGREHLPADAGYSARHDDGLAEWMLDNVRKQAIEREHAHEQTHAPDMGW